MICVCCNCVIFCALSVFVMSVMSGEMGGSSVKINENNEQMKLTEINEKT